MQILLPFYDDSTLIFAAKLRALLLARGIRATTLLDNAAKPTISERQINQHLPDGPGMVSDGGFYASQSMDEFDAAVFCKVSAHVRHLLSDKAFQQRMKRPAFVAFQPGLEFTPDRGRKNRATFDIVFLNNVDHRDSFKRGVKRRNWQYVSFGHPYFLRRDTGRPGGRDIYFFAQAISPISLESRRFIIDMLITLARRHPDRDVYVKLRHLPGENATHVHREEYDYPWIIDHFFPSVPPNFKLTACTMDEALGAAGLHHLHVDRRNGRHSCRCPHDGICRLSRKLPGPACRAYAQGVQGKRLGGNHPSDHGSVRS